VLKQLLIFIIEKWNSLEKLHFLYLALSGYKEANRADGCTLVLSSLSIISF